MSDSPFHLFGIRHHGPGCARSLLAALQALQPDCLLIEGPPEAETVLPFAHDPAMVPPITLLIFNPDNAQQAAFYPFAEFSPEWQALRYGARHDLPVRFMDLPAAQSFALQTQPAEQPVSAEIDEPSQPDINAIDTSAPLDWLGRAAGYDSGESWWNHLVEERNLAGQTHSQSLDLFAAIREAMTNLRAEIPQAEANNARSYREQLREASMRKIMRQAQRDGYQRIAVICGAWHLPALEKLPSAKADNDLLKALEKIKVSATWVPWSFQHLSYSSGYGAGVDSPEWYQAIWEIADSKERAIKWLARAAQLLREQDIDCSSAHIIEAMRFAQSLAALRQRPQLGLEELVESLRTCVTMGNETPIQFIRQKLIIGNRLGEIPSAVPSLPLQRDLEQQQKSLRLKPEAGQKVIDLDLRKESDLARSHLLHRLQLLGIPWGQLNKTGRSAKGSFHEIWTLQWDARFALDIISASRLGNSIISAASAKVVASAEQSHSLGEISQLLHSLLLADLPQAVAPVSHTLENLAAISTDILELLAAIPPLVQIARYGNVRNTDTQMVEQVLHSLIPRAAIALPPACHALDDEAAKKINSAIVSSHQAICLLAEDSLLEPWLAALRQLLLLGSYHGLVSGLATRLLFDRQSQSLEQVSTQMSQALSVGVQPPLAAAWLEGFLNNSGMILLHDDQLWRLVNDWLCSLQDEYFLQILPLLRRTFSTFNAPEKRQLGERARQAAPVAFVAQNSLDSTRAALSLPYIRQLLGLSQ
ncbi:MAG TPA: DUF5682 family protein [Cellvibrio sp.]|nr:DUF5682 family protein [Cellvibrio sp.]